MIFRIDPYKGKVASFDSQQSFFLHLAQLIGHGAAVYAQIVRQLLPIKRDIKLPAALPNRLEGKIAEQSSPNGFRTGVKDASGEIQVFLRRDCQQILNQLIVKAAGIRADIQDSVCVQKQYFRGFR